MDRGAWATAHGVTKELDVAEHTWAREQKHSPKTGPVMNLNRKGTRCQSTVPYGPARLLSPGFPVCFSLTASICQGKKKKKRKWQRSIWLIQEKLGREISLPWSCFSANPLSWTPRSISPLLLSGDENFSASMESPSQLQSHSCFPTKADK